MHETLAEPDGELPTRDVRPERTFDGQRFVPHEAGDASWAPAAHQGFEERDTDIAAETDGLVDVRVLRRTADRAAPAMTTHDAELSFRYVLRGGMTLHCQGGNAEPLAVGDAFVVPAGIRHRLDTLSDDLELLSVVVPGPLTPVGE